MEVSAGFENAMLAMRHNKVTIEVLCITMFNTAITVNPSKIRHG